jgi:hypothetical protein
MSIQTASGYPMHRDDAVDGISGVLDQAKPELAACERVGRATVFD